MRGDGSSLAPCFCLGTSHDCETKSWAQGGDLPRLTLCTRGRRSLGGFQAVGLEAPGRRRGWEGSWPSAGRAADSLLIPGSVSRRGQVKETR